MGLISISAVSTVAAAHNPTSVPWQAAVHTSLEEPAQSLYELSGRKGPCPSNIQNLCYDLLLIVASDHRGAEKEEGGHC